MTTLIESWTVPAVPIAGRAERFPVRHIYEPLPGDLVFTGTPAGVGAVGAGDRLDGGTDGLGTLAISIVPAIG